MQSELNRSVSCLRRSVRLVLALAVVGTAWFVPGVLSPSAAIETDTDVSKTEGSPDTTAPTESSVTTERDPTPDTMREIGLAIQDSEYEVSWQSEADLADVDASWHAPNRAQNFRTYFTGDGIRVVPRDEAQTSWRLGLSLIAYGRGGQVQAPRHATLTPDRKRIEYFRVDLTEWYVNDKRGLEQGFTLRVPPQESRGALAGRGAPIPGTRGRERDVTEASPAYLALALTGDLRPELSADGQAVDLKKAGSLFAVAHYGGLSVMDANGRELPAWMELFNDSGVQGIRLVFDDRDAVYPVTVDPLLTTPSWTGEGDQSNAQFGYGVAGAGDVNGDGYADVLVGAPYFDRGQIDEGRAFLFLGSPSGLQTDAAWVAESDQAGAGFGCSVATAGDVNGDGWDDIVIGADAYDNGQTNEGMVFVYHGSATGPDNVGDGTCPAGADWYVAGVQFEAVLGRSVATAGDVNGDGYDDIIVSAPFYDNAQADEGAAFIYHGSSSGLTKPYARLIDTNGNSDHLGYGPQSVASAGDVNHDGYDDVIVGAPHKDSGGNDRGYVAVHLGSSSGILASPAWSHADGQDFARAGFAVAGVGDVNGDGYDDVALGYPYKDTGGHNDSGAIEVYLGNSTGTSLSNAWYTLGTQGSEMFGKSVAGVGDIDGDGCDDIVVGSDGYDRDGNDAGRVYIILGMTSPPGDEYSTFSKVIESDQPGALLGQSVAGAGDVNGDGWADVVMGAPGYTNDKTGEGRACVYHSAMVSALDLLQEGLGLETSFHTSFAPTWAVLDIYRNPAGQVDEQWITPAGAIGYGPFPGSIMLSTGALWDPRQGGPDPNGIDLGGPSGDPEVGDDVPVEYTRFQAALDIPPGARTLRFTTQFLTGDWLGRDRADVSWTAGTGSWVGGTRVDQIMGMASGHFNAPVSHALDVENATRTACSAGSPCDCTDHPSGCPIIIVSLRVSDHVNGWHDSALIISNMYFSEEPLPSDIAGCYEDPSCPGQDWPNDGVGVYLNNPAPADVSLSAGTYSYAKSLLSVQGKGMPFDLSIFYNSAGVRGGALSRKWTHTYESYAQVVPRIAQVVPRIVQANRAEGSGLPDAYWPWSFIDVIVKLGSGLSEYFEPDGMGGYKPKFEGAHSKLTQSGDNFTYVTKSQVTYQFNVGADTQKRLLGSTTDANGNTISFVYDTSDRLDYVIDTREEMFSFNYDSDGRLTTVRYPEPGANWATATLAYHSGTGDLKSVTDVNGYTTNFTYDEVGNLLTETDADGITFVTSRFEEYQGLGVNQKGDRVVVQKNANPGDAGVSIVYDREALTTLNRTGGKETKKFDVKGRLFKKDVFLGQDETESDIWAHSEFSYDLNNNMISEVDPLGHDTTMEYDSDTGDMTSRTDALGNKVLMTYDSRGNRTSRLVQRQGRICDPAAPAQADCFIDTYVYGPPDGPIEEIDKLLSSTDPLGYTTYYSYTSGGLLETITDPRVNTMTFAYDSLGNQSSVIDPYDNVASYTYDLLGRRTSNTDPTENTTHYSFDTGGRLLAETDPLGHTTSFTYDAQGRLLTATDPLGSVSRREYTPTGMLKRTLDPLGHATVFAYDAEDRLASVNDPLGRTTTYGYDAAGRLVQVTDPEGGIAAATYDLVGNQTSVTSPGGRTTSYAYDALGRDTTETDPLQREIAWTYEERGLIKSRTNARGDVVDYTYDDAALLWEAHFPPGGYITHTRDPNGNIENSESNSFADVTVTYDFLNRPLTRTVELTPGVQKTTGYEYDAAGNVIKVVYSDGTWVDYDYDGLNRVWRVTDWNGKVTSYTYDAGGNLKTTSLPDGSIVTYGYDPAHRLTSIVDAPSGGPPTYSAEFTLDATGRKVSVVETLLLEPTISDADEDFTYDAANQLLTRGGDSFTYDADGNLTSGFIGGSLREFTYDALNQLDSVDDSLIGYDASGFRVEVTRRDEARRAVYDHVGRLLEEYDESNNLVARYVYGMGLISRVAAAGSYSIYHFDSRGSTVALAAADGTITDKYAYAPYGLVTERTGTTDNPFTYDGRDGVQDDANGLYFMKSRYYAPELMRFIQKDQAFSADITDGQSLNRYAYVQGDPIQFVDPDGELFGVGSVVGAVVGAGISIASDVAQGKDICWECAAGAAVEGAIVGSGGGLFGAMAMGAVRGAAGDITKQAVGAMLKNPDPRSWEFELDLDSVRDSAIFGAVTGGAFHGLSKGLSKRFSKNVMKKPKPGPRRLRLKPSKSISGLFKADAKAGGLAFMRTTGKEALEYSRETFPRASPWWGSALTFGYADF